ncbi:gliding motility-associated-like protein [Chitinophaga dinghuensis]|uniref:Gliding motility-associated-like protein n=1 Tax=Chitinophaga dinghuensis TaxID=1539050 RepID=A0A327WDT4_9BACT|nr:gliding motility-associated C-terminal domain-containing protein [Chitinophaga dinghuensis]RAJ87731.1 gliding motility-associated-like protein [Chitinophaga dinghuensis]
MPLILVMLLVCPFLATAQTFTFNSTCVNDSVYFAIKNTTGIDSVKWHFGDPGSAGKDSSASIKKAYHIYTSTGTYTVTLTTWTNGVSQTVSQPITIVTPVVYDFGPQDVTLCEGGSMLIQGPVIPGVNYLWQDSSTQSSILADTSDTYKLKIDGCLIKDSVNVFFTPIPKIDLGPDLVLCTNENIQLDATAQNCTYLWNTGNTEPVQDVRTSGTYSVTVYPEGCPSMFYSKTVTFTGPEYPFSLGPDTLLCPGESVTLAPKIPEATAWLWSTGSTAPSVTVNTEGDVWALVEINHTCSVVDTIFVNYNRLRKINLGNDTTLCQGNFLVLTADFGNGTYTWQDNSDQATYYVTKPGNYYVHAQIGRCESFDTIHVSYVDTLRANLGMDTILCRGTPYTLYPRGAGGNFKWQDSTSVPVFTVTKPGVYSVSGYNECGKTVDSVVVRYTECSCTVFFPNAFTPNGDGRNDYFRPVYRCPLAIFQMSIYNRWGERMFYTTDPQVGWRGTYRGEPVAMGTYVYVVDYVDKDTQQAVHVSGAVTVVY